ncbi:unnamed protein product [Coccothraustes coccothraustes]
MRLEAQRWPCSMNRRQVAPENTECRSRSRPGAAPGTSPRGVSWNSILQQRVAPQSDTHPWLRVRTEAVWALLAVLVTGTDKNCRIQRVMPMAGGEKIPPSRCGFIK